MSSSLNSTLTCAETLNCSLDYYATHFPDQNNAILLLDDGTHYLHSSIMLFEGLRNLSVIGSNSFLMSSESLLEPATKIQCIGRSGFVFTDIQDLNLCNVSIVNCGGRSVSFGTAALLLINTFNVSLYNVFVKNSVQYGMLSFDMLGSSHLSNCSFISNASNLSGGNVLLSWSTYYDDICKASNNNTLLHIDNSIFAYGNSGGNKASGLHIDYQQPCKTTIMTVTDTTFIKNRGGNIAIFVKQGKPSLNIFYFQLENVVVMNGLATDGTVAGGMSFVVEGDSPSSQYYLNVRDSLFKQNTNGLGSTGGLHVDISGMVNFTAELSNCKFINNTGHDGGAVSVNLTNTAMEIYSQTGLNHVLVMISFISCTFEQNNASKGGGIFVNIDHMLHVASNFKNYLFNLNDCLLSHNTAVQAGSALMMSNKLSCNQGLSVTMSGTVVEHNQMIDSVTPSFTRVEATTVFEDTYVIISNSTFSNNTGSGILADNSKITFTNTVTFASNSAFRGGALQLSNTQLYLLNGTYLIFENNLANEYGGAIYIYESPLRLLQIQPVCFVVFKNSKPYDNVQPQLVFINNTAKYGGTISAPQELTDPCTSSNGTIHNIMFNIQDESQLFPRLSSQTVAKEICVCVNSKPKCEIQYISINVIPGRTFDVQVATVNYKGEIVPSVVSVSIENEGFISNSSSIIGEFQTTQYHCTNLNYILLSYNPVERVTMSVVDYSAARPINFLAHLLPCPVGFAILQETSPRCDCIPQLHQLGITCQIDNETFQINSDVWIGTSAMSDKENTSDSMQNDSKILFSSRCPFGYCIKGFKRISLDDPDAQCSSNRCGTLCGQCLSGLSISLGRANCIECSNAYTALLVFVFGAVGLGLIAFLRLFNVTISQGSPNPFMFYANVIHANDTFFFSNRHADPLTVFISWMNLDFGIESCFYDGMDALQKAFLQFIFPSYLLIMIGIIIFVSQRSIRLTRLMGGNSVSIISTLLHLSFFKLFRATIAIFLYTKLHYENGEYFSVWRYDGNINYNHWSHVLLILLSSGVLIFFIIPYIIIIVCTPIITTRGYRICCIRFWKFMPIFDAYLAPYKYKFTARSWNGITTFLYSILLITSTEVDTASNLLLIAISSLLLVALNGLFGGIYRNWAFSVLEAAVHLNLTCLALLSLFAILKGYTINAIVSTSIGLSLFAFCVIIFYHCAIKIIKGRKWSQFKSSKVSIIELPVEQDETEVTVSVVDLPTLEGPYTYNYYYDEEPLPEPKPVPRARDEILVTASPDSTTALIPRNSNLEPPPTSTEIAFEDLNDEEDTKVEELIRNNQTMPENFTDEEMFNTVVELEVDNAEPTLSINTSHTSQRKVSIIEDFHAATAVPYYHESDADSIGEHRASFVEKNRYSRKELYSYKSARPIDSDTNATGQRPTQPLDSDTNATGQKPSRAPTKCDLVRLVYPLELAIVNELEGDNECDTQMKVHKLKYKKTRKHKKEHITGRLQDSKSVAINMARYENEFDENIPLLSMEATNNITMDTTASTAELEKKQMDFPSIPFEGL